VTQVAVRSTASGKAILFGEHAVVYGEPAIAVPVTQVRATAIIEPAEPGQGLTLVAADLGTSIVISDAPKDAPLAVAAWCTLSHLAAPAPDATLTVRSQIPVASGLGSGAAVSAALVRALASFLGRSLTPAEVSGLVFEVEKIHHGTPSGIDNSVIAYERPVYFERDAASGPVLMSVGAPFNLLIADTGLPSPTRLMVDRVRRSWQQHPERYQALFGRIGRIAREARRRIESGEIDGLGMLMNENHALLIELGVSSPILDGLVGAARAAGASGAKLSGAGQGGAIVALVAPELTDEVAMAAMAAGAATVMGTEVE
jgi:mevalonate kinase